MDNSPVTKKNKQNKKKLKHRPCQDDKVISPQDPVGQLPHGRPQDNWDANYAKANLMQSQADYDSEDDEGYIPCSPKAEVYAINGEWCATAAGGRTAPMQRAPRNRVAFSDEQMRAVKKVETPVLSNVTTEPVAKVLAKHKQDPQDSQRQEHLSQQHLQHQPQSTGATETRMSSLLRTCHAK